MENSAISDKTVWYGKCFILHCKLVQYGSKIPCAIWKKYELKMALVDISLDQRVEYEIAVSYLSRGSVFGNHIPQEHSSSGIWFPPRHMKLLTHIPRECVEYLIYTPHCFHCNDVITVNYVMSGVNFMKKSHISLLWCQSSEIGMDLKTTVSHILPIIYVFWTKFTSEIWKT